MSLVQSLQLDSPSINGTSISVSKSDESPEMQLLVRVSCCRSPPRCCCSLVALVTLSLAPSIQRVHADSMVSVPNACISICCIDTLRDSDLLDCVLRLSDRQCFAQLHGEYLCYLRLLRGVVLSEYAAAEVANRELGIGRQD